MDNNDDLYTHVKTTIQKIRNRGDKPTTTMVTAEAKRNKQKTLKMFNKIMDEETQSKRDREASAISHDIGAAILKDREECVAQNTAHLNDIIERMNDTCALLHEEISSWEKASGDLEQQLSSERETYTGQVNSLEQLNAQLQGTIQSMQQQESAQKKQLEAVEKQRDDSIKDHFEECKTLAKRNEELKASRTEAGKLRQQLSDASADREKAEAARIDAEKASERLEGINTELRSQLQTLRKEVTEENRLRIEAVKASAVASARLDDSEIAASKSESGGKT